MTTIVKNKGVPPKEAQAILGHSSIITTLEIDAHVSGEDKPKTVETISDYYR